MSNKLTYTGIWWYPDEPKNHLTGTLTYDDEDGGRLTLVGSLDGFLGQRGFNNVEAIYGVADNRYITIVKPYGERLTTNSPGPDEQVFRVYNFFVGDHISPEEMNFNQVSFSTNFLPEFVWNSAITKTIQYNKELTTIKNTTIRLETKKDILISKTDDYQVYITYSWKQNDVSLRSSTVTEKTALKVKLTKAKSYTNILNDFVRPLHNLIAIGTDSPNKVDSVVFKSDSLVDQRDKPANIEYYSSQLTRKGRAPKKNKLSFYADLLFSLKDIKGVKLRNWLSLYEKYKPVIEIVSGIRYSSGNTLENILLNSVSAAEAYHRRRLPNFISSKKVWLTRINRITNDLNKSDANFVNEALEFSNEKRLNQRLSEIYKHTGLGQEYLSDSTKWNSKVRKMRNALTHYDPRDKKYTSDYELMYQLSESITWILIACLLRDMGFSKQAVKDLFKKNQDFIFHQNKINEILS